MAFLVIFAYFSWHAYHHTFEEGRVVYTSHVPHIYAITPTYERFLQIPELTRLKSVLTLVNDLTWIIVEDGVERSSAVSSFLKKANIKYVHLFSQTPNHRRDISDQEKFRRFARGVDQRNAGLEWLRGHLGKRGYESFDGVVYFMDDDNTYDARVFTEMRSTKKISVWPVGFAGGLLREGPLCKEGKVTGWNAKWNSQRMFAIDMAGFALNLNILKQFPNAQFPIDQRYVESPFLRQFNISFHELEPKGKNCEEVFVWHTQTKPPNLDQESFLMLQAKFL